MSSLSDQPLVTVYIPTYNRLELLQRAVKSVQNQTYQNLEIIIVDDCSTDGTQKYLAQLAKEDKRVRYFIKEKNSGACVSRNIAIENATGEFITGLDDDDYFLRERIALFLENYNANEILFTNLSIMNYEKIIKNKKLKVKVCARDLIFNNYIGNQIFTKTCILKEFGGFDVNMPLWQDLEAWYNILSNSNYTSRLLSNYTYVLDVGHDFLRITNSKLDKLEKAHRYFSVKHKLSPLQQKILYTNIYNYEPKKLSRSFLMLKLILGFNLYDLKKIVFGV